MRRVIERIAVLGAGNGGKACAADLSLQGKSVRLYESSEFAAVSLDRLVIDRDGSTTLRCSGAIKGDVDIKLVTCNLRLSCLLPHQRHVPLTDFPARPCWAEMAPST